MKPTPLMDIPTPGIFNSCCLAEVVDLVDPENLARVQVRLLNFDGVTDHDGPIWARLGVPLAGNNRGTFWVPDIGDEVLVAFVNGDSRWPVVIGGLWNGRDNPPETMDGEGNNYLKVFRSRNGVKLTMDDTPGQEAVILETPGGQKITLKDGPGTIEAKDSNGNTIEMAPAGISVTASAKVTITASSGMEVTAPIVTVNAGMSKFSGVVQADSIITNSIISASYTPGAGNIW